MTTTFIVVLAIVVGLTVGIKMYLQDKDAQEAVQHEVEEKAVETKTHEQIISERLAEIAKFEEQVSAKDVVVNPVVEKPKNVEKKTAPKKKKYYASKKQQPKIKAK